MKILRPLRSKWIPRTAVVAFTLLSLGCGGGGGDDGVVAQQQGPVQTGVQTGTNAGNNNNVSIGNAVAQTFTFPTFDSNSRLTVVGNFQTTTETPSQTARVSATLSSLSGVNLSTENRALGRVAPEEGDSEATYRCGYGDVCALDHLLEETENRGVLAQQPEIRARFQDLPEGARRDFFLIPAFRDVTGQKVLEPIETEHCTIFAEVINDQPVVNRTKALAIAEAFDSNNPERPGSGIYDQVRQVFGSEWNQNPTGGNDGDEKVVIFFFSSQTLSEGLFGYVSPADADPDGGSSSNRGEIIYVNADKSNYQTLATIAHEFQHVVNQNQKINRQGANPPGAQDENITVNEGLSGLAEEVCGFTYESGNDLLLRVTNDYLEKPDQHEFFDFFETGLGYGQGYLFFRYVREHFGDQTVRAIATDPDVGITNLNDHLPGGFGEVFRRWTIANYATNLGAGVPSIYRYPSGFRTDATFQVGSLVGVRTFSMDNNEENLSPSLKPWSASYLTIGQEQVNGLRAEVAPASGSPYAVIFEEEEDIFTSLSE